MLELVPPLSSPWLVLRELLSPEEIREYFHVRYLVYTHNGFLAERADQLDVDCYDPYSRFVGAYDTRSSPPRMIGGCRMILPDSGPHEAVVRSLRADLPERPSTYYVENTFALAEIRHLAAERGHRLVEFGRNVCLPEYRRHGVGMALVHAIYGVGLLEGVRWAVAVCPPHLQTFYEQLGCLVLERKGTARFPGLNTELMTMVLDLTHLIGSDGQARQCAAQLWARGYVETCGQRDCLARHVHSRPAPVVASGRDEWSPREARLPLVARRLSLHDDTLGGGLESGRAMIPSLEACVLLLGQQEDVGLESACLGFPTRHPKECAALLAEVGARGWKLSPSLAGRARLADLEAIAEANRQAGFDAEAVLEGTSRTDWAPVLQRANQLGLRVTLAFRDAPSWDRRALERALRWAAEPPVVGVRLNDTSGRALPSGARRLVSFVRERLGQEICLEWGGSQNRGMAVANCLAAVEAGAGRIVATALGIGAGAGHAPLEQVLELLERLAGREYPARALARYLQSVSHYCGVTYPTEPMLEEAV